MKIQWRRLILKQFFILIFAVMGSVASAQGPATGVATTGVNFRSGPSTKYRVLTGVPKGEFFDVIGKSGRWTKVRLSSGKVGYIYSKYVGAGDPVAEGGYCEECGNNDSRVPKQNKTQDQAKQLLDIVNPASGFGNCITNKIVTAAKWVHRNKYGGRTKGRGKCQYAIRYSLQRAGVWPGGGYGNAKDVIPTMLSMGFKNLFRAGMTPKDAPAGAILVYGKKLPGARCKGSLGNTYGHIELKENNNSWLYDGNPEFNIQQAYGAKCRPLKGVMVMGDSCPTCTKALKRSCGG